MKRVTECKDDVKKYIMDAYYLDTNSNLSESERSEMESSQAEYAAKFEEGGAHSKYGLLTCSDAEMDEYLSHIPSSAEHEKIIEARRQDEANMCEEIKETNIPFYGLTPEEYETYSHIGSSTDAENYKKARIAEHKANGEVYDYASRDYVDKDSQVAEEDKDKDDTSKDEPDSLFANIAGKIKECASEFYDKFSKTTVGAAIIEVANNTKEWVAEKVDSLTKDDEEELASSVDKTEERTKKAESVLGTQQTDVENSYDTEIEA